METIKSKVKSMFGHPTRSDETTSGGDGGIMQKEEWEVRPGGMLVQKRVSVSDSDFPKIKVKVKYNKSRHDILITSHSSFGELKKVFGEKTGLHPDDLKIIYKNRERDSNSFLDIERVKDGSKLVVMEDTIRRQRRFIEMLKNAKIEKVNKSLTHISSELDKCFHKVQRNAEIDIDIENSIETLMAILVKLDELVVDGDLKLRKRFQEKRAQSMIESLERTRTRTRSIGEKTRSTQAQEKHMNIDKALSKPSETFFVTTKWETFD